jgi:small subunit ribosomal protein S17
VSDQGQTPATAPASEAKPVTEPAAADRARRKVRTGVVVSDAMDKTVLVRIDRKVRHPLYQKTIRRSNKLAAHDENNDAHVGDMVRVMETRPLSKSKRWRVVEIVERAK